MTSATIPTVEEITAMCRDMTAIDEALFEAQAPQEARWEAQAVKGQLSRARKDAKAIHMALETGSTLGGFLNAGIRDVHAAVAAYNEYKATH